jgi:hypothetical protein
MRTRRRLASRNPVWTVAVLVSAVSIASAAIAVEKPAVKTVIWDASEAVGTLSLDRGTLSALGFETALVGRPLAGHVPHVLSVAPAGAPSYAASGPVSLSAAIGADGFHGFEGGGLRLTGGFRLRLGDRTYDFTQLELRASPGSTSLELVDAEGNAWLTTADAQWEFDLGTGRLRYLNADVRILPALAERLGDARYAGVGVGLLALDATLRGARVPDLPTIVNAPPPCGDWSGNVDVGLVNMSSIGQAGISTVNGRSVVVVLPSAELKNVGTANVPWFSKFTNLGVPPWNDQHPFLVWQMTRTSGGVFEPLGRSDLKHAFLTINTGCAVGACTDSHVLGIDCADVYSTGTNNSVGSLAPRAEISASTGIWSHCGGIASHFDTNGDCVQDFSGSGENSFTHGLKAAETDLQVAGASYYVEAFYIVRNDVNIFNSMGYRQVAPAKPASVWTFPTVGAYATGPAINAWVNPTTPGAGADNRLLDTGEGRVQLAVRTFEVPGNPARRRFAYALQNHDFDRRIKSLRIPFTTAGAILENIVYVDGDGFTANDWTAAVDAGGITWTAPAATTPPAELDYASVVSFRFDSNLAAVPVQAALGVFEAGDPTSLALSTLAPESAAGPSGGFYTLTPCRLLDTRGVSGGPAIADDEVRELTVAGVCGVPAGASAVALNVTITGASSTGRLALYASNPSSGSDRVNFGAGATRANNALVALSLDGKLRIQPSLDTAGSTHVVIDVVGYFVQPSK